MTLDARAPRLRSSVRLLIALAVAFVMLALAPRLALARSYEVCQVDIDATVGTDGTLEVVEERSYRFEGSFGGIYWDVPRSVHDGRAIDTELLSVGVIDDGVLREFSQVEGGATETGAANAPGTYELRPDDDCYHITLYWPSEDRTVTFHVAYRAEHLATRWADTGELYWQYVPADGNSGGEWTNVTATVHLPVPTGEAVTPGENVRAWGHGPLDGEVRFSGNDAVFFSPGVGSAEFLEARVVFPESWLPDAEQSGEDYLATILAEEDRWARDANTTRVYARFVDYGTPGLMLLIAAVTSLLALAHVKGWSPWRPTKARFDGTYYRDVPSNDHPAVLGMLWHDGTLLGEDFTATLMRLVDEGRVELEPTWRERTTRRGNVRTERDYRLAARPEGGTSARTLGDVHAGEAIDGAAYAFIFETIAEYQDESLRAVAGNASVLASSFADVAKAHPSEYNKGIKPWVDAVRSAYGSQRYEVKRSARMKGIYPGILSFLDFGAAMLLGLAGVFSGAPFWLLAIAIIVLFAAGIYCIWVNDTNDSKRHYTQEGLELRAKLAALKRWLEDFTRLEEAIPTDVVLWNRLLVMATVLGVAKQVVAQLRAKVPELLDNPAFVASTWYQRGREDEGDVMAALLVARSVRPQAVFRSKGTRSSSSDGSHHSTRDYSNSRDSSSRGSGGGFSSGGGGGYHGGGRGGAF